MFPASLSYFCFETGRHISRVPREDTDLSHSARRAPTQGLTLYWL